MFDPAAADAALAEHGAAVQEELDLWYKAHIQFEPCSPVKLEPWEDFGHWHQKVVYLPRNERWEPFTALWGIWVSGEGPSLRLEPIE